MTMKITIRKVRTTYHASCFWATGVSVTEVGAVRQVAKCLASSSKPMIALKYGRPPLAPGFSVEYVTSMKHEGLPILAHNIRRYVRF